MSDIFDQAFEAAEKAVTSHEDYQNHDSVSRIAIPGLFPADHHVICHCGRTFKSFAGAGIHRRAAEKRLDRLHDQTFMAEYHRLTNAQKGASK